MVFGKLFGRKRAAVVTEVPRAWRRVLVRGTPDEVARGARAYEEVTGRAAEVALELGAVGDGWVAVDAPFDLHPYLFHNLASWLGDRERPPLLLSEGADEAWCYYLAPDPRFGDFFSGYQRDGTSLSVHLPDHRVARGEALEPGVLPYPDALTATGLSPAQLRAALAAPAPLAVRLDRVDAGEMNATMATNLPDRQAANPRHISGFRMR
jgi:hypothetical protein